MGFHNNGKAPKMSKKSPHPILDRELRVLRVSTVSTGASLLRVSRLLGRERSSRLLARLASQGKPVTKEISAAAAWVGWSWGLDGVAKK